MMPMRPPSPCRFPGCTELTRDSSGYCQACKATVSKQYERTRETATARGYSSRWRKVRDRYLQEHPLCIECEGEGRTEVATVVDHILPHKGDQALFWDPSNWQPLCRFHHNRKTASQDGGLGNASRGEGGVKSLPAWRPRPSGQSRVSFRSLKIRSQIVFGG